MDGLCGGVLHDDGLRAAADSACCSLKSARDISLPTFLLFSLGVFLWLLYGLYTGSRPVIASNAVTLVLSLSILYLQAEV